MRSKQLIAKAPPADYANILLKQVTWKFPSLKAVIETPTLRADGRILQTPGYDPDTWLYYMPSDFFEPYQKIPPETMRSMPCGV
jgi:hypothetical protein